MCRYGPCDRRSHGTARLCCRREKRRDRTCGGRFGMQFFQFNECDFIMRCFGSFGTSEQESRGADKASGRGEIAVASLAAIFLRMYVM